MRVFGGSKIQIGKTRNILKKWCKSAGGVSTSSYFLVLWICNLITLMSFTYSGYIYVSCISYNYTPNPYIIHRYFVPRRRRQKFLAKIILVETYRRRRKLIKQKLNLSVLKSNIHTHTQTHSHMQWLFTAFTIKCKLCKIIHMTLWNYHDFEFPIILSESTSS